MKKIFSWESFLDDYGICKGVGLEDKSIDYMDAFLAFYQWDEVLEKATMKCAQEKKGTKLEFDRLGKKYLLEVSPINDSKDFNFQNNLYEID